LPVPAEALAAHRVKPARADSLSPVRLKLPTMTAECEKAAARRAKGNVDHLVSLLRLCERELLERGRRAAARRLKAAKLPAPKAPDTLDFTAAPSVNEPLAPEPVKRDYIGRREDVILIGAGGSGETHPATASATEARARGERVAVLPGHRAGRAPAGGPGGAAADPAAVAAAEARPAGAGRAGVRAGPPGRRRPAVRRDQHGVRAVERGRDDGPAVRGVEGGADQRAADGGHPRPADPPPHDRRDRDGELPTEGGPAPPARGAGRRA